MKELEIQFITEYERLCNKHSYYIGACGCCDSPWVTTPDEYESIEDHINHLLGELKE